MTDGGDWSIDREPLPRTDGERIAVWRAGRSATFREALRGLAEDADLRFAFNAALAAAAHTAFRWETPGLTAATADRPFGGVLLNDRRLDRPADPAAFAEHFETEQFENEDQSVATFPNLGGNAILLAPRPLGPRSTHGHLAAFVRFAPEAQRDALWRRVGEATLARLNDRPVWLNTAGAGVPWLHVRLDDRPKYYRFAEYRAVPGETP